MKSYGQYRIICNAIWVSWLFYISRTDSSHVFQISESRCRGYLLLSAAQLVGMGFTMELSDFLIKER